jgi:hypothetical protein
MFTTMMPAACARLQTGTNAFESAGEMTIAAHLLRHHLLHDLHLPRHVLLVLDALRDQGHTDPHAPSGARARHFPSS